MKLFSLMFDSGTCRHAQYENSFGPVGQSTLNFRLAACPISTKKNIYSKKILYSINHSLIRWKISVL